MPYKDKDKRREAEKRWKLRNTEKIKAYAKIYNARYYAKNGARDIARKYNISPEEYKRLNDEAKGVCNLCGRYSMKYNAPAQLHVDHCHRTGTVRGLLCFACNSAIGRLGDTVEAIQRVLVYVSKVQ